MRTSGPSLRALWCVAGCDVLAMATWFSASAVVSQIAASFGIAQSERGWITAAVQLGFVTGAVSSAIVALSDWVETRTLIRLGTALAVVANASVVLAHSVPLLLALRFLTGFGLALVYPPSIRLLAAWFRKARGLVTGIAVGALTLGSFSPHLYSGAIPWRDAILGASILAACAIPIISFAPVPAEMPRSARFDLRAVPHVLANDGVVLADAGYWGHMWELYAVWAWAPLFYAASLKAAGVSAPSGALVFLAFGVFGAFGCVLAGAIADRVGRSTVAGAAMLISGSISLSIGWLYGGNPVIVTALLALWGFSVVADSAQFSAAVADLADPRYAGTALTLQMGVGFLITMATIWLVGFEQAANGWGYAFTLLALGPALGVAAMVALRVKHRV